MKIAWVSDLDFRGSGYFNISIPLCNQLVTKYGHEVKVVGLGYGGEQHDNPFSIIPIRSFQEATTCLVNLANIWGFDVVIVALDIPMHEQILRNLQGRPFKYIGIMPIEADPLSMSWATTLVQMDRTLVISKFGTEEAKKSGVRAKHIPIGIDTNSWKPPTIEERKRLRESFGLDPDEFVVLTVADNQERKNLGKAFEIIGKLSNKISKLRYMLVTREHNMVGWNLRDMASFYHINRQVMIFERGMSFPELWALYAVADAFLLSSKTEGLGMPLLEALSCGVPCVATNATGMKEVLSDGRGLLADYDYVYVDPFGNSNRYFMNADSAVEKLLFLRDNHDEAVKIKKSGRKYAKSLSWDISAKILQNELESLRGANEQKE